MARRSSLMMIVGRIFGSESTEFNEDSSYSQEAYQNVKKIVIRGTLADLGTGEGDSNSVVELARILKETPQLVTAAVSLIKARIKDPATAVSCAAIDFLDQCMLANDFEFIQNTMLKVLGRILKLAVPNIGIHPHIQSKAAEAIKVWGMRYGSDVRLDEFSKAVEKLNELEATCISTRRFSIAATPVVTSMAQSGRRSSAVEARDHSSQAGLRAARRGSAPNLSHVPNPDGVRLAEQFQQVVEAQMQVTVDKNLVRKLQQMHDQVAIDLNIYHAREKGKPACE